MFAQAHNLHRSNHDRAGAQPVRKASLTGQRERESGMYGMAAAPGQTILGSAAVIGRMALSLE